MTSREHAGHEHAGHEYAGHEHAGHEHRRSIAAGGAGGADQGGAECGTDYVEGATLALGGLAQPARPVVRRTVVQSDWLRFARPEPSDTPEPSRADARSDTEQASNTQDGEAAATSALPTAKPKPKHAEVAISHAARAAGPFVPVNDKTNKAYREAADAALGGSDVLRCLAKFGVISERYEADRAYARSHLIAAEFAGQKKFKNPSDNIRFHPASLEYGEWQHAESKVKATGTEGYLTVTSAEGGVSAVNKLAQSLAQLLAPLTPEGKEAEVRDLLVKAVESAHYVPKYVKFDYSDENGQSFEQSWDKQDAGLAVSNAATASDVVNALLEADVHLPEYLGQHKSEKAIELGSRDQLVALLRSFGKPRGRMANVVKSINGLIAAKRLNAEAWAAALKKFPEMNERQEVLRVTTDINAFNELNVEEVLKA